MNTKRKAPWEGERPVVASRANLYNERETWVRDIRNTLLQVFSKLKLDVYLSAVYGMPLCH